ncbi:MAG: hypothetical protein RIR70_2242 [Pseudomonadota bacterium]|jgi:hypothetical protein
MSERTLERVIDRLAQAMSHQRSVLEASDYAALEALLPDCESALAELESYPGGMAAVKRDLDALPEVDRQSLAARLERANIDHRVGRDLIALAMQRSAALHAFAATQSESATYSQEGSVSHATGSLLSRKV